MKYLSILAIFAAVSYTLSGCATTGTTTTTSSGEPVAGEQKSGEESRLQPGAGVGPNASVKW